MDHELIEPTAVRHRPPAPAPDTAPAPAGLPAAVGNAAFTKLVRGPGPAVHRDALRSQGAGPLDPEIAGRIASARGGGTPLPESTRADMEGHLGTDLSGVRVHTDSTADTLSRSVQATAFTTGNDVFFAAGRYDPSSTSGRGLLAHELTHVAQQSTGTVGGEGQVSHPSDPAEVAAAKVGETVAAAPAAPAATVAREGLPEEEEEPAVQTAVAREAAPGEEEEEEQAAV